MSLLLLLRPRTEGVAPPVVVEPPVVARGADGSRRKGKLPRYWWEEEKRREVELPYKPPPVTNPVTPMHIVYDDPVLRVDAKLEVEYVYRRKKRRKQIAVFMSAILEDE